MSRVWLLWELEDYEKDTLHGIYSTEKKADAARVRLRKQWRRENVKLGIGPEAVWPTKRDAFTAADSRADISLVVRTEVVR